MQTEAVSTEKSKSKPSSGKDPVLLGVSLPISVTVSAATKVKDAWFTALTAVIAAARANIEQKKNAVGKKANDTAKAVESEINA